MKHIILVLAAMAIFSLYIGHITITIAPFSVQVKYPIASLGTFLMLSGAVFLSVHIYHKSYEEGYEHACNKMNILLSNGTAEVDTAHMRKVAREQNLREIHHQRITQLQQDVKYEAIRLSDTHLDDDTEAEYEE